MSGKKRRVGQARPRSICEPQSCKSNFEVLRISDGFRTIREGITRKNAGAKWKPNLGNRGVRANEQAQNEALSEDSMSSDVIKTFLWAFERCSLAEELSGVNMTCPVTSTLTEINEGICVKRWQGSDDAKRDNKEWMSKNLLCFF